MKFKNHKKTTIICILATLLFPLLSTIGIHAREVEGVIDGVAKKVTETVKNVQNSLKKTTLRDCADTRKTPNAEDTYVSCMETGYDREHGKDCSSLIDRESQYIRCMNTVGNYDLEGIVYASSRPEDTLRQWYKDTHPQDSSSSDPTGGIAERYGNTARTEKPATNNNDAPAKYNSNSDETPVPQAGIVADEVTTNYVDTAPFNGREGDACYGFLGLIAWDCNVNISDQTSLENGISHIAANILTDIIIIAGYLVLGYTIYGGYQYIFSAGDPNKVASSKKTLSHAFIGLAIVLSAQLIMSTIRFALIRSGQMTNCATADCITNSSDIIINAIQWTIGISGVIAVIFVVYGGIMYTTSAGDPNKLQKAKQMLTYALIGLAIVGLSEIITAFVSSMIRNANEAAANFDIVQEKIIAKEQNEEKPI